ncbi:hypothetical protein GGX14DRAFT_403083 [Mycena pura]|uniref:Uncharacterized protein n=1 Tax=Mycena pura TaxID=153505 RepID=A0AAD6UWW8_9AGAR|nr:hypothetical protein GGX14DRAFT_403083 [Mycena pura]
MAACPWNPLPLQALLAVIIVWLKIRGISTATNLSFGTSFPITMFDSSGGGTSTLGIRVVIDSSVTAASNDEPRLDGTSQGAGVHHFDVSRRHGINSMSPAMTNVPWAVPPNTCKVSRRISGYCLLRPKIYQVRFNAQLESFALDCNLCTILTIRWSTYTHTQCAQYNLRATYKLAHNTQTRAQYTNLHLVTNLSPKSSSKKLNCANIIASISTKIGGRRVVRYLLLSIKAQFCPLMADGEHKTKSVEILDIFGKFMPQRALGGPVGPETWISMPPQKGHLVYKKWLNSADQNLADFGDG